jgi:methylated-DNA-[protein]-cysteine S-methyltransferase
MQNQANETITEQVCYDSPVGKLFLTAQDEKICAIQLAKSGDEVQTTPNATQAVLKQAVIELNEYFSGTRKTFTFAMNAGGTVFQKRVWQRLSAIPFGELRTYGQIAAEVDNPKASRAVGMACNKNPIMIAVPCHRVVGAGGKLVGFAYGTQMKQQLLDLEQQAK